MLTKLLKYDILADYKKYCAVYIAMLAASVMILMSSNPVIESMASSGLLIGLIGSAFFALSAAVAVMVVIFSVSRFYKNLVRDEGYLMHTLPVPTWQLLASKLITVYIWTISTVVVEFICLSIAFEDFNFFELTSDLIELLSDSRGINIFIVYLILAPFSLMSCIYFAFALGNLFSKNKLGMSVAMYFAVKFAERILSSIISAAVYASYDPSSHYDSSFFDKATTARFVLSWLLAVGYFIAAERIFSKKLNLE